MRVKTHAAALLVQVADITWPFVGAPLAGALIDRVGFRAAWGMLVVVALLAAVTLRAPERTEVA